MSGNLEQSLRKIVRIQQRSQREQILEKRLRELLERQKARKQNAIARELQ